MKNSETSFLFSYEVIRILFPKKYKNSEGKVEKTNKIFCLRVINIIHIEGVFELALQISTGDSTYSFRSC